MVFDLEMRFTFLVAVFFFLLLVFHQPIHHTDNSKVRFGQLALLGVEDLNIQPSNA